MVMEELNSVAKEWFSRKGIPAKRMTEPDMRRRIAKANVVVVADKNLDKAAIIEGASIGREYARGRGAEFRPVQILALIVDSLTNDLFTVALFVQSVRGGAQVLERYGREGPPLKGRIEEAT